MKKSIYFVISITFMLFNFDASSNSVYIKGNYNLGINYSDSFKSEYVNYERLSPDFTVAIGYKLQNGLFCDIEMRYANIRPMINKLSNFEHIDLLNILQRITNHNVSLSKAENILTINAITTLINVGYSYIFNDKFRGYFTYGVGIGGLLNYQGFKSSLSTYYGISMQSEIGVCYIYNSKIDVCIGYNYLKNYWKYETDRIPDEDGNTVMYNFQDFQLNSHTIFLGLNVLF
ncbi:Hypothetical protein ERGA_CDS_03870 [Ehrlichia ruminantium str. Gardel]|nr:Hypothetical protein ERGA_CDS_03870 [Ehrlichia ruminantium str. Gardel]